MARQTRAQRRARREQQAESRAQQQPSDGRARAAAVSQRAHEAEEAVESHVPGRRGFRFIHESIGELRKVDWPGQSQVIQATTVVVLACAIVGVYLWGADLVLKRLVEKVFLGQ
jgi:preprotein translocase subunit SecE